MKRKYRNWPGGAFCDFKSFIYLNVSMFNQIRCLVALKQNVKCNNLLLPVWGVTLSTTFQSSCARWPTHTFPAPCTSLSLDIASWFGSVWSLGADSLACALPPEMESMYIEAL